MRTENDFSGYDRPRSTYRKASALLLIGGLLGVAFMIAALAVIESTSPSWVYYSVVRTADLEDLETLARAGEEWEAWFKAGFWILDARPGTYDIWARRSDVSPWTKVLAEYYSTERRSAFVLYGPGTGDHADYRSVCAVRVGEDPRETVGLAAAFVPYGGR